MRFTASHSDGFTERLLSYTLTCSDGTADIVASWFRPTPPTTGFRATFDIDPEPLTRRLPVLRAMVAEYQASWDDLDHKRVVVELPGETLRWDVYGGGVLRREHPELRPWFELWEWLEEQVSARLPA